MTIQAIFENGVFRPTVPVDLPEQTAVEFDPKIVGNGRPQPQRRLYELLGRSYDTGQTDAAARHDEHVT